MDHALRRKRLAARVEELELDALLVTRLASVRYLTGFTGSNGQVLLARGDAVFFTDGRYAEQSAHEVPDLERVIYRDGVAAAIAETCGRLGVSKVGFEAEGLTYRLWEELRQKAGAVELVPGVDEAARLRWVKDEEELELIARAQETADRAFEEVVLSGLREGTSERELAFALELAMRRAGADELGFPVIAAFGELAAEPHHHPTDRPLRRGDVVKLDFGALVEGYHSDMTRTVAFGEPPARLREVREVVAAAQRAGIGAVRAGATSAEVDRAARSVVEEAGLADRFPHGLGHGVGLEIHEGPFLRWDGDDVLPAGAVVTIEPGVYIPSLGGVRIEDMVLVTEDG
ncbi:MAG TPA: aminopeptidase P family protein, partial [Actinomycetota bacterium]|nr:aminopeptidase P family protein [Actinomycetota bacterium]